MEKLITFRELRALLGNRGRTTIYSDLAAGRLPQPLRLGGKLYWRASELDAHLRGLAEAQRAGRPDRTA